MIIKDFYVQDFGKLWRSCGNCKSGQTKRQVEISGVVAKNGKLLAGANENYGGKFAWLEVRLSIQDAYCFLDTVTIKTTKVSNVKKICARYQGNSSGAEPTEIGSGPDSKVCLYTASDITTI